MPEKLFDDIAAAVREREERSLSSWACLSAAGVRRYSERPKSCTDALRPVFFRDTDRIIHSRAYTRYIDKTQVFYLFENDHLTHRVLHVQFVAKIGRVIGRALGLNEDLIEAIALGHDLGHSPYGHDGERVLDALCRRHGIGSFAHNVQSVRALMEIEKDGSGLNLSLQVLDGILCHNGELLTREYRPQSGKTWDDLDREYQACMQDSENGKKIFPMTLEGCVVRISDVIAYIGRDVEDAVRVRLISKKDVPSSVTRVLGTTNDRIIDTLVKDLVANSHDKPYLLFSEDVFNAIQELKQFNYERIYSNPAIKTQSHKIKNIFEVLFQRYLDDLSAENEQSTVYRYFMRGKNDKYIAGTDKRRIVVDFIAGMTDDYFNNQFRKMFVPESFGYSLSENRNAGTGDNNQGAI